MKKLASFSFHYVYVMKFYVLCSSVSFIAMDTLKTSFNEATITLFMIKKYLQLLFMAALTLLLSLVYCTLLLLSSSLFFDFILMYHLYSLILGKTETQNLKCHFSSKQL